MSSSSRFAVLIRSQCPQSRPIVAVIWPYTKHQPPLVRATTEAKMLADAEHKRNYAACLKWHGYCDPFQLTVGGSYDPSW